MSSRRLSYQRALLFFALGALWLGAAPAHASHGSTVRASVTSTGAQLESFSESPVISADGRWLAFSSAASNLVPGDTNGMVDVFVRDLSTETIERVSVSSEGRETDGPSQYPSLSADGRFVAFWSAASLAPPLGPAYSHTGAFVHDRLTGTTIRASVDSAGAPVLGYVPGISGDGRFVAFWTGRALDSERFAIGLRDLVAGETTIVRTDSAWLYQAPSAGPVLSHDGRHLAFVSSSPNLVGGDTNNAEDVFVYDHTTGATERVSVSSSGMGSKHHTFSPSISADGRYVAFVGAGDLVEGGSYADAGIFVRDRLAQTTNLVSHDANGESVAIALSPSISADGTHIAFAAHWADELHPTWLVLGRVAGLYQNLPLQIYVRDLVAGRTRLASQSTGGQRGNDNSDAPRLSGDGHLVAFSSWATNLVPSDSNGVPDVFLHDVSPNGPTCTDGGHEEGPVSGRIHEQVEPAAGPAQQAVHDANCSVIVRNRL